MSRGYYEGDYDECDPTVYLTEAWLQRAIKGKRGQAFLRALVDALDAMPEHALARDSFAGETGFCTLGALGHARGLDMTELQQRAEVVALDGEHDDIVELNAAAAEAFGVAKTLVAEVMWLNDSSPLSETPEQRWLRMRTWAARRLANGGQ